MGSDRKRPKGARFTFTQLDLLAAKLGQEHGRIVIAGMVGASALAKVTRHHSLEVLEVKFDRLLVVAS